MSSFTRRFLFVLLCAVLAIPLAACDAPTAPRIKYCTYVIADIVPEYQDGKLVYVVHFTQYRAPCVPLDSLRHPAP